MKVALISNPACQEHHIPGHPESRQRIDAVSERLQADGLWQRLVLTCPPPATVDVVAAVHDRAYVERVEAIAMAGGGFLDGDTGIAPGSYRAAMAAAGCAVHGVDMVQAGDVSSAFALVRPPGHHASRQRGMGFCLFNNVAIAAMHALDAHGLERVVIVDFDAHHGNGTQDAFYADPRVLYFSTHLSPFFPGTGHARETGVGAGLGYTINVPLPYAVGDAGFERAYSDVLAPAATRFRPQLMIVSAGYDVHWADPLTDMAVSTSGIARVVRIIVELAQTLCEGRVVFVLEGGYRRAALADGVAATVRMLLGDETCDDTLGPYDGATADAQAAIDRARQIHGLM